MSRPQPWPFDRPLPSALTSAQLRDVMGLSDSQFYALQKAGKFRRLEVTQPIGYAKYSGHLVDRWRRGESIAAFGKGSRLARAAC